jgi:hypothetical protein
MDEAVYKYQKQKGSTMREDIESQRLVFLSN